MSEFVCNWTSSSSEQNCNCAYYDKFEWEKIVASGEIPYLHPELVPLDHFLNHFLLKNLPCMFSPKLTSSWLSRKDWVRNEGSAEEINFDFLVQTYVNDKVIAVNCGDEEYKEGYGTRDCREMLFREYVEYWKDYIRSDYSSTKPCLYLKDWHIVRYHKMTNHTPSELPYTTPLYFLSDWLNEDCGKEDIDDFKLCYMGPKGSFTGFHADVYGSYSWSANVLGVKRWYLYPPGKEMKFRASGNNLKFDWENPGVAGHDFIEVLQNAGECLFVPSGWHHVVWNLVDTISINHNWFNGANVCYIWKLLQDVLGDVEKELEEFREIPEFADQCQVVLKANHGMNYAGFVDTLKSVFKARREKSAFSKANNSNYIQFDMAAISHVIQEHCQFPDAIAWLLPK